MCGRYYIDDDTYEEAEAALIRAGLDVSDISVRAAVRSGANGGSSVSAVQSGADRRNRGRAAAQNGASATGFDDAECRDITPGMTVPVLFGENAQVQKHTMRWGLHVKSISHLVINTRSETADVRPLTADSYHSRRCVLPARGFYEWDRDGNRYRFTFPDQHILLLGGIYDLNEGEKRFSILTKNANRDMEKVHERMPVIIPVECAKKWLFGGSSADELLQRNCHIVGRGEFVQQSLADYFHK